MRLLVGVLLVLLVSCTSGDASKDTPAPEGGIPIEEFKENKKSLINDLEKQVWGGGQEASDESKRQLLVAYSEWGNYFRDDDATPEYLFQAGRLGVELNRPKRAIELFTEVHDGFPDFDKRIESAYMVGHIYDQMLNDRELASKAYLRVVEFYPESNWALQAQLVNDQLYVSDEEIIKMLEEKNQVK